MVGSRLCRPRTQESVHAGGWLLRVCRGLPALMFRLLKGTAEKTVEQQFCLSCADHMLAILVS